MSTGIGSNPVDRRTRRRQTEDYLYRVRFMCGRLVSDFRFYSAVYIYNGLSSVAMTVFDKSLSLCPQLLAIPKS